MKDRTPDLIDARPGPYGSIFWLFDRSHDQSEVKISIGWAMPGLGGFDSGALTIKSKSSNTIETEPFLPFVEEALGVVHNAPSKAEQELNAHFERLAADYLLFLVHRMLFAQCKNIWVRVEGDPDPVDEVLIFGPTLPKFRGRICYTHLHRRKTVAIVAPDCRIGRVPVQSSGKWADDPTPAFWHDCSARTWRADLQTPKDAKTQRIASFDIILPTGDGLSRIQESDLLRGSQLWNNKAAIVKNRLDNDREGVRLTIWKNEEVFLPKGLARAARAAVLHDPVSVAKEKAKKFSDTASPDEIKLRKQIFESLGARTFSGTPEENNALQTLICYTAIDLSTAMSVSGDMANRDARLPKNLVKKAIEKLKDELGDYAIEVNS